MTKNIPLNPDLPYSFINGDEFSIASNIDMN